MQIEILAAKRKGGVLTGTLTAHRKAKILDMCQAQDFYKVMPLVDERLVEGF